MSTVFNKKQMEAIEMLAQGRVDYQTIAATINVSPTTLFRWRRKVEFAEAVQKRALELLQEKLPAVYSALHIKAAEDKDVGAMRLFFERLDKIHGDVVEAYKGQVTFTWKQDQDDQ